LSRFTSTKVINTRWRNNDFVGAAGSTHTFPDAFHEEFLVDWALQIADGSVVITETPTTGNIQVSTLTVGDIVLTGTASGDFGTAGGAIIGTSPISVATAAGTSTISLNANYSTTSHLHDGTYQPFGTYITSITGAAPITTSGTTAITVGIDQAAITAGNASSAQATVYVVRNNTASTILKGTLVGATGAEPSGRIDIAPFSTTGLQDSELRVMGIATENIGAGVNGTVMSFGTLTGLDTRGTASSALAVGDEDWDEGTILYAHPTVPGKLTEVRPQHDLAIAFTTVRHASTGQIAIRIVPGNFHLEWLHDVSADNPSDGDIIQYKTSSSLWTKDSISGAGIAASVHTHPYQAAGTYVTAVNGTAPITASTDTAGVVTVGLSASYASDVHTHATSSVTSGNFVATLAAGTGVTVAGADANAAAKTVSIGQAVATSSNVTFNDLNINGDNSLWICRATRASGTQSLTNNSDTKVALDTASSTATTNSYDPHSWFSDADDNIVIGQAGVYNITATVGFAANATSRRSLTILVNSAAVAATQVPASPANETSLSISTNIYLDVGDTVHMNTRQNSGGALNTSTLAGAYPVLSVARVGA
jgi:hypothetical protein